MQAKLYLLIVLLALLKACSQLPVSPDEQSPNAGRYQYEHDHSPPRLPTLLEMTDPEPSSEPLSRGGNNPYRIFGIDYQPKPDLADYQATGIASWYGMKFHGHKTSNGEVYDMFSMSAAHKTLPLPSYVRVTNLNNQQSAIVRVNDRGPFHQDRLIDLSYAAAHKIGLLQQGTAPVQVELLRSPAMAQADPAANAIEVTVAVPQETWSKQPAGLTDKTATPTVAACYIQVFASQHDTRAKELSQQIQHQLAFTTKISHHNGIFRLLVGPIADPNQANDWLQQLRAELYPSAYFTDATLCS